VIWVVFASSQAHADDATSTAEALRLLKEQNQALQEQLRQQQIQIESLARKVTELQETHQTKQPESSQTDTGSSDLPPKQSAFGNLGKVNISGEGGVGFFASGSQGPYPHPQFRVDEARLFVEAPIVDTVYFYSELNLATREEPDVQLRLGELYLDFENVSRLWNCERLLNVRVGRIYTPFGEEYQTRYAIDNPLISHSLSDLWAVNAGAELYGHAGKFNYAVAVQNAGISDTQDFDDDESVAGRVGFDPNRWLHLSVSGMRTGNIDAQGDKLSSLWFANGFFRSLGSPSTTKFHADLVEGDVEARIPHGHLRAFGGYINYNDNDPTANNQRNVYYYAVEGVHDLIGNLYFGLRFSQIFAPDGFPIVANGNFVENQFAELTKEIWRLSLGLGYRWSQNLLLKAEYTYEQGELQSEAKRKDEDLFAVEAAYRF
jgi:hypothetical protein